MVLTGTISVPCLRSVTAYVILLGFDIIAMADAAHDPMSRLAKYWYRANLMHAHLHEIRLKHTDLDGINNAGRWWEFETFLLYWLSALFVLLEGFNKLKLKDARVQRLFKEHIQYLKAMRHETYHFVAAIDRNASGILKQLNWAEELHEAIGEHIKEYVNEKMEEEDRAACAAKRKKGGKKS